MHHVVSGLVCCVIPIVGLGQDSAVLPARDYIYPQKASVIRAKAVGTATQDGATVSYSAQDGTVYSLRQFNGLHIAVLMKQDDLDHFTVRHVRELIDHLDILYAQFADFMGGEPAGDGLLRIAFVKNCGAGCGYIGAKGIELDPFLVDPAKAPLGIPDGAYLYAIHEMTHNFDLYSSYIMYGPDIAHAWTDFLNLYIQVFNREGGVIEQGYYGVQPAPWLQYNIDRLFKPYLTYPNFAWTSCVRDNTCDAGNGMAQHAQGGFVLRVAQLHDAGGMRGFVKYLAGAIQTRQLDPAQLSVLQKNDLLLESLAYGVNADISCYADAWKWTISGTLRQQLSSRFGLNPLCADKDGDGYGAAQGDFDDTKPAVHPGALEIVNGVDDDCNGVVDDILLVKQSDFPPTSQDGAPIPSLPVRIQGAIADPKGSEGFRMTLGATTKVVFRLTSLGDFQGWIVVHNQDGSWNTYAYAKVGSVGIAMARLGPGIWTFEVAMNASSNPGKYELLVQAVPEWPTPAAAPPAVVSQSGSRLFGSDTTGLTASADTVRYWVSTYGWVGTAKIDQGSSRSFLWRVPSNVSSCSLSYRYQFLRGDLPVLPVSTPTFFPATTVPCAEADGVVNGASFQHGPIAPGEIVTLFGQGIGPATLVGLGLGLDGKVQTEVGQTRVLFDGVPAPVIYAQASQTAVVVPYSIAGKVNVNVQVEYGGVQSAQFSLPVTDASPAVFLLDATRGAILNQDSTVNSPIAPAARGSIVVIYGTGEGITKPAGVDGAIAGSVLPKPVLPLSVAIGGRPAEILYAGAAPASIAGLLQINARIATSATTGSAIPVVVKIGDRVSPAVTIAVR